MRHMCGYARIRAEGDKLVIERLKESIRVLFQISGADTLVEFGHLVEPRLAPSMRRGMPHSPAGRCSRWTTIAFRARTLRYRATMLMQASSGVLRTSSRKNECIPSRYTPQRADWHSN